MTDLTRNAASEATRAAAARRIQRIGEVHANLPVTHAQADAYAH